MSYQDDDFEGDEDNGPKALRSALKKAQARIAELTEENSGLKTVTRKTTVAAELAAKNLPAKLAGLYTGEPDPESIAAWIAEYADVLGSVAPSETTAPDHSAVQKQYAAMNEAQSLGSPATEGEARQLQALGEAKTMDELLAVIQAG